VHLPANGLALLHHVHADDVAHLYERALRQRERAVGETFSAVAPHAMSMRGCATFVAGLFGREPVLEYASLEALRGSTSAANFAKIASHVAHSPCVSMAKAAHRLGYQPRSTTEQIYLETIEWLLQTGQLTAEGLPA